MNRLVKFDRYFATSVIIAGVTMYCTFRFVKKLFLNVTGQLETLKTMIGDIEIKYTIRSHPLKCSKSCETDNDFTDTEFLKIKSYSNDITELKTMKAKDWIYDKEIISVYENMTVNEALESLTKNSGTCALVFDSESVLLGVMDTHDVLTYILRSSSSMDSSAKKVVRRCVVADGDTSVSEVCKHLCNGLRYIAIKHLDEYQIVSQRSIVTALYHASKESEKMNDILENTVYSSDIGTMGSLITCTDTCSAKEAFELMAAYGITSLPIMSGSSVVGVISATDILYSRKNTDHLKENVLKYTEFSRIDAGISRDVSTVVSCAVNDKLATVLHTMMHEKVHHIYVMEGSDLKGVISFLDLLKFFSLCSSY